MGSVAITSNVIRSTVGLEACWWLRGGNGAATPPGEIVIAGNTCAIDANRHGALVVGNVEGPDANFPRQNIYVCRQPGDGPRQQRLQRDLHLHPGAPQMDGNVWDPAGGFSWGKAPLADFASWQKESGGDKNSRQCTPSFAAFDQGDLQVKADDACARGLASDLAKRAPRDRDGKNCVANGPAGALRPAGPMGNGSRRRLGPGAAGWALLLSSFLALGSAELICRQFVTFGSFRWVGDAGSSWNEPDEELEYRLAASWRGWLEAPEYRHRVEINSRHFRGPEPSAGAGRSGCWATPSSSASASSWRDSLPGRLEGARAGDSGLGPGSAILVRVRNTAASSKDAWPKGRRPRWWWSSSWAKGSPAPTT